MAKNDRSNDNLFQRLTQLFRAGPIVKRKIKGYRAPTTSTAQGAFKKSFSHVYSTAMSSYGTYDRQSRYSDFAEMLYCLAGDTKIAVPGGYKTLEELSAECEAKGLLTHTFDVFSYDHELRQIVRAKAKQARQTRTDQALEVVFDNGQTIVGTLDHKLLQRDGSYVEIGVLKPGDELMSFLNDDRAADFSHRIVENPSIGFGRLFSAAMRGDHTSAANFLKITDEQLARELAAIGFDEWKTFESAYFGLGGLEHVDDVRRPYRRVASIRPVGIIPLYDLTVEGYKNFATDIILSHNTPEISSALDIYCLAGNNTIPLLDGRTLTIKELFDANEKDFYVYSFDVESQKYVPGLCKGVKKTGTDQNLVRITFDDGTYIRVTADHRVLLRDGTYLEASKLQLGDALRPVVRKLSSKETGDRIDEYEMIYQDDASWEYTHRLMGETVNPSGKGVIHHKNFRKWDNTPVNLEFMTWKEHQKLHANTNTERWEQNQRYSDKMSQIFSEHAKKMHAQPGWTKDVFLKARDEVFGTYTEEERKKVFGRPGEQNGMFGSARFDDKNPRWRTDFKREFTKQEIVSLILSGISIKDAAEQIPTRTQVLTNHCKQFGIKKWSKLNALRACPEITAPIIAKLREHASADNLRSFSNVCKVIGISRDEGYEAIYANGYVDWSEFVNANNHRVVSVVDDGVEDVFDLTVEKYHNFAVGIGSENSFVVVHNSEECASPDDKGQILHIYSENRKIQRILEELFYDTLNVEFNITPWIRNLCQYGDAFLFNDVSPEHGVLNVLSMPVNEVEREEGFDPKDPLAVRFRWATQGNQILENWQVTHFRLLGNDAFLPYGASVLEPARRIWRQLILIEDAMLVYRVVRSPERRVFYIDVGAVPPEDVPNYMEQAKSILRSNAVIDPHSGRVDLRYNPLSVDEDYWLPMRGESTSRIETLPGGTNVTAIEDVQYIQAKLFAALKIPKAYLGYDDSIGSKATLSQEDIRFSRTINRIQRVVISELNKLAVIHLYAHGYEGDDLLDFTLSLSNPSTIAQQQKLEIFRTKLEIATSTGAGEGLVDRYWLQKNIMAFTDDEIDRIAEGRIDDKKLDIRVEAITGDETGPGGGGSGSGGGGGGGGSALSALDGLPDAEDAGEGEGEPGDEALGAGGGAGGAGGPGGEETPPDAGEEGDAGGEEAPDEEIPEDQLFAGHSLAGSLLMSDEDEDLLDLELDEMDEIEFDKNFTTKLPSRVSPNVGGSKPPTEQQAAYRKKRNRQKLNGPGFDAGTPDLNKMVSHKRNGDSLTDPYDTHRVGQVDPFKESRKDPLKNFLTRGEAEQTKMTAQLQSMVNSMSRTLPKQRNGLLSEAFEEQDLSELDEILSMSEDEL